MAGLPLGKVLVWSPPDLPCIFNNYRVRREDGQAWGCREKRRQRRQYVPLMDMLTWALAKMQMQDVCTFAQFPGTPRLPVWRSASLWLVAE